MKRRTAIKVRVATLDWRKADRIQSRLPVAYAFKTRRGALRGQSLTTNFGGGGVRFIVQERVKAGMPCELQLKLPGRAKAMTFMGEVAWCTATTSGAKANFEVAVSFLASQTDNQPMFRAYCQFVATQLLMKYLP